MNFKKLVRTGALFVLIAGITVTYVSKDTEIRSAVDSLKAKAIEMATGKKQAEADLLAKQEQISSILSALGLSEGATTEEILSAIGNLGSEADLSALAEALGLPADSSQEQIIAEITSLNSEIADLEGQADTLTAKINQLVADLEQANSEEASQLAYIEGAIAEVDEASSDTEEPAEAIEITLANEIKKLGWTGDRIDTSYRPNQLYLAGVDSANADAEQNKFNNSILAQYFTMNKNSNWYLVPTDSTLDLQVILDNSK